MNRLPIALITARPPPSAGTRVRCCDPLGRTKARRHRLCMRTAALRMAASTAGHYVPFPLAEKYKGTGNPDDATDFVCAPE